MGSSIARETDTGTYIAWAGNRCGLYKSIHRTGDGTHHARPGNRTAEGHNQLGEAEMAEVGRSILRLPDLIAETLELNPQIEKLSAIYTYVRNFLYLGRGYNSNALEGALKLKEISYIQAEGISGRRDENTVQSPSLTRRCPGRDCSGRRTSRKVISNIQQVKHVAAR